MVCRSDLRKLGLRRNGIDRIYSRCQAYAADGEARIKYVSRDDVIKCVQAMAVETVMPVGA